MSQGFFDIQYFLSYAWQLLIFFLTHDDIFTYTTSNYFNWHQNPPTPPPATQ